MTISVLVEVVEVLRLRYAANRDVDINLQLKTISAVQLLMERRSRLSKLLPTWVVLASTSVRVLPAFGFADSLADGNITDDHRLRTQKGQ